MRTPQPPRQVAQTSAEMFQDRMPAPEKQEIREVFIYKRGQNSGLNLQRFGSTYQNEPFLSAKSYPHFVKI